ncbi:MAG TPA: thioesterase family protein [Marmoricola sp.]|jgi:predicted thioesterase|nr:thioesterase family protein [Marmoricola sp.]
MELTTGLTASATFTVTDDDTAAAVGSGTLPVLGTPRLLAWCEAVTCSLIDPHLDAGATSVGTRVALEHLAASPVGTVLEVAATTSYVDGRNVRFAVTARQDGKLVGNGEVARVVVDAERFLARVSE